MTIEEIQARLRAIVDAADGRDMTDEEHDEVETLEGDLATAKARRERTLAARKRITEGEAPATVPLHGQPVQEADDTLEKAFTAYLRTGRENADIQELRAAQSEGVPSEGGFLVPPGLRQKFVERMKAFGGLASVVEEFTTDSGQALTWVTMDDTQNVGEVVEENGTFVGGADLVFGQAQLSAYSYMAGGAGGNPLRLSRELVQDAGFDVVGKVSSVLGTRMARIQAQHLVTGDGVKKPKGIVAGRTGIQTAANNAITYKDLLAFVHSIDPAYRESGNLRWAMNDTSLMTFQGLLDASGRPLLTESSAGIENAPGGARLLGYPVTIDQGFPNFTNNSPTINWGVFGDLSEGYVIRRVRGVEVLANPYSRLQWRQIEYSAWARMDALPQNSAAYVALTGKT